MLTLNGLPIHSLRKVDLKRLDLADVNFSGLDMWHADLRSANLTGTDFRDTRLTGADFRKARVVDTNFTDARMYGADFRLAYMVRPVLDGAMMREIKMDKGARFMRGGEEHTYG